MIYSFEQRIGMSQSTENWKLEFAGALNLMQDCAMYHTVAAGCGPDMLGQENLAWVINCWDVFIDRPCDFLDTVKVSTWAHDYDRLFAHRNFRIDNSRGEPCMRADTMWFLMRLDRQMPVRIRERHLTRDMLDPALDLPPIQRHIDLPGTMEERESMRVPRYAVDANRHMNNVWYVRMAMEYLPEDFPLKRFRAEYVSSAHYGDVIVPAVGEGPGIVWVDLRDQTGNSFVKLEFSRER